MSLLNFDLIAQAPNRVLDFGPHLDLPVLASPAYTLERLSLWTYHPNDDHLEMIPLERGQGLPSGRAEGTLYAVTDAELEGLDLLRGNGVTSERKRVHITIPGWNDMERWRPAAYVYFGIKDHWLPRIAADIEVTTVRNGITRITEKMDFKMCPRRSSYDSYLNNRFSLYPEFGGSRYRGAEECMAVAAICAKKNQAEIHRLRKRNWWSWFLSE